ncbi:MAG: hypothetical protein ABJQ90_00025 [Parasphingorhabdus sp.]
MAHAGKGLVAEIDNCLSYSCEQLFLRTGGYLTKGAVRLQTATADD